MNDIRYVTLKPNLVNSPTDFVASIGKISDFKEFEDFLMQINDYCENNEYDFKDNVNIIQINQYGLVKSESCIFSNGWMRCKIIDINKSNGNEAEIFLLDEGFKKLSPINQIRLDLPSIYHKLDPQAKKCELKNAIPAESNNWSIEAIQYFREISVSSCLVANKIKKKHNSNDSLFKYKYIIQINNNGVDLLQKLIKQGYASLTAPTYLIKMDDNDLLDYDETTDGLDAVPLNDLNNNQEKSDKSVEASQSQSQVDIIEVEHINDSENTNNEQYINDDDDDDDFVPVVKKTTNLNGVNEPKKCTREPSFLNDPYLKSTEVVEIDENENDEVIECDEETGTYTKSKSNGKKFKMSKSSFSLSQSSSLKSAGKFLPSQHSFSSASEMSVASSHHSPIGQNGQTSGFKNQNRHKNGFYKNKKPYSQHEEIGDDEARDLYTFKNNSNDGRRVLKPQSYIYSDETIMTGYTPNIEIDGAEISRQIKAAYADQLHKSKNYIYKTNQPNFEDKTVQILEERIYDIITGNTYDAVQDKTIGLVNVFKENPKQNAPLIIKCILREIKNFNLPDDEAFELLNSLKFLKANNLLLPTCLKELIDEYDSPCEFSTSNKADTDREGVCILLAKLYKKACTNTEKNKYMYLNYVPNFCSEKMADWLKIYENKDVADIKYSKNLRNIRDFLKHCLCCFKMNDVDMFDTIYDKISSYNVDSYLNKNIRKETHEIMDLYARSYKLKKDWENLSIEEESKRLIESYKKCSTNTNVSKLYIVREENDFNKRSNFLRPLMSYNFDE